MKGHDLAIGSAYFTLSGLGVPKLWDQYRYRHNQTTVHNEMTLCVVTKPHRLTGLDILVIASIANHSMF